MTKLIRKKNIQNKTFDSPPASPNRTLVCRATLEWSDEPIPNCAGPELATDLGSWVDWRESKCLFPSLPYNAVLLLPL